jgi:hypothetical protein
MKYLIAIVLVCVVVNTNAQNHVTNIKKTVTLEKTKAQVTFLAADELKGRDTGSPELNIASKFIESAFINSKIKPAEGTSYFQEVPFTKITPPTEAELKIGDRNFSLGKELAFYRGNDVELTGEIVFVGYGSNEDFQKADVKGKIVIALFGSKDENKIAKALFADALEKNRLAKAGGATALFEIFLLPGVPFSSMIRYLNKERTILKTIDNALPHGLLQAPAEYINEIKSTSLKGTFDLSGVKEKEITSRNVIGMVEGTDPILKKEFIVLSAHYDHVGVGEKTAEGDSIFNGARDNAIGTVALLSAADHIGKNPLKRSVLFIALAAEEKGLLGSSWYVDHPMIPLKNCVFGLNTDGAGYNDKTSITINGLEHTSSQQLLDQACKPFNIIVKGDPAPEQDLYSRSDNFSFAKMGIPSINFAPGVAQFDQELMRYYHKQDDEVDTLDFDYILKYMQSFVNTAAMLGDAKTLPGWLPGSRFAAGGTELYK